MTQYKVFRGTLDDVGAAINGWLGSLAPDTQIVSMSGLGYVKEDGIWFKEFVYTLRGRVAPVASVPSSLMAKGDGRG